MGSNFEQSRAELQTKMDLSLIGNRTKLMNFKCTCCVVAEVAVVKEGNILQANIVQYKYVYVTESGLA